jgi:hypothetical protein
MGSGTLTAYQHDATLLPNGTISVFDNGGVPMVHPQSRAIVVALNPRRGPTLLAQYEHPTALKAGSQGNVQQLANGNLFTGWGRNRGSRNSARPGSWRSMRECPAATSPTGVSL